jgi:integral membrane protein (TIGR01906 family)
LIGALLVFLVVRFDALFEQFHRLFFAEGTWVFEESSTLIRLFPFVFWRDAFALVLVFTFVVALLLVIVTFRRKQKPAV